MFTDTGCDCSNINKEDWTFTNITYNLSKFNLSNERVIIHSQHINNPTNAVVKTAFVVKESVTESYEFRYLFKLITFI